MLAADSVILCTRIMPGVMCGPMSAVYWCRSLKFMVIGLEPCKSSMKS